MSLLLSIEPLLPTFTDRDGLNSDYSIRLNSKLEFFIWDSFFYSAKLNPKLKLVVDVFSPSPVWDYFLFNGGLIFLIEVWESNANELSYGILIWFVVGDLDLYLVPLEKFGIRWSSSIISKSDFFSDF